MSSTARTTRFQRASAAKDDGNNKGDPTVEAVDEEELRFSPEEEAARFPFGSGHMRCHC